jgi:hypothetical protein
MTLRTDNLVDRKDDSIGSLPESPSCLARAHDQEAKNMARLLSLHVF